MKTRVDASGTSFFDTTIDATIEQMVAAIGPADCSDNGGGGKTNFDWARQTPSGTVFTVYDWKYYRRLRSKEIVNWHIGGFDKESTEQARRELERLLQK
jgi:hypothetical protein